MHQRRPLTGFAFGGSVVVFWLAGATQANAFLDPINLAQGKNAYQSSTLFGADALRAVDGNANGDFANGFGSVTHTDFDLHSWWEVDLGEVRQLSRIEIVNRTDCCAERLTPFVVIVADIPIIDTDITDPDTGMYPGIMRTTVSFPVQSSYAVPVNRSGRFVRIALLNQNYLSLAEVRVIEADSAARGRIASQSSTRPNGDPGLAVDGNMDGVFLHNSVSSTNVELRPWWQVDLGGLQHIRQVDIWSANTDCCATSNPRAGFWVWFSPTPITADPVTTDLPGVLGYYVSAQGNPAVLKIDRALPARYIRVELNATDALSLAEVQVWPVARGAVGGHAKLSTTATGSDANLAIDFNAGTNPAAVSKAQTEPYLDIDLGGNRYLETVTLWSQSSLSYPATYNLFVSNTDFKVGTTAVTTVAGTKALRGVTSFIGRGTPTSSTTAVMREARFVRVMLDGQATLGVRELEIGTTQGYSASSRTNGSTVPAPPPSLYFNASGFYPRPNVPINIYAFRPNTGSGGGAYVLLGSTTTDNQVVNLLPFSAAPTYGFSLPGLPTLADTFPAGGVGGLYYTASDAEGAVVALRSMDADGSENVFWPDVRVAATSTTPDNNATKPPYLDLPLGATKAPYGAGAADWSFPRRFSFETGATTFFSKYFLGDLPGLSNVGLAPLPVEVFFYNGGELGLARRVTCVRGFLPVPQPQQPNARRNGTACSVAEYAPLDGNKKPVFGDPVGALNALDHSPPVSISAIVIYDDGPETWFATYAPLSDNFWRSDKSQLDSTSHNLLVPNNCMTCHAGTTTSTENTKRGFFLPFNISSYTFPSSVPYASQVDNFRKLSAMFLTDNPTPQIADLINGTYRNAVNTPGTTPDLDYIPAGWRTTPGQVKAYTTVIKPYCRACHNSQLPSFGGIDFFKAADAENLRAMVVADVCKAHRMPHAQQTMKQFWRSGARAQLLGFFGRHDFDGELCAP